MTPIYILSVVYLAAIVLLLVIARRNKALYAAAKGFCSTLFLVCALLSWFAGPRHTIGAFALLLGALVLCAFGDVLLGVANRRANHVSKTPFVTGAISFTLAHVVFCVLFYRYSAFMWYDALPPLLLMGCLWLLEKGDRVRLKKMRPMGYIYTFMVALMAWKAAESLFGATAPNTGQLLVSAGALLFLISDVILLFLYFGTKRHRWIRGANLLSYYLGVFLMAASAQWM